MKIKLNKNFKKHVKGRFEKYTFEVGVLTDAPHRSALRGAPGKKGQDVLTTYAGGPVRKTSRKAYLKISEVSERLRKFLGFNYLQKPFLKKSSDLLKFTNEYFKLVAGKTQRKRVENLLQAVVRNPMLRGDYGSNSKLAQAIKGFDRLTIDTGQLFKAIKARVKVRSKV